MNKFKTKKRFGQHLLISEGVIKKIVDEIEISPEDTIVEIGVGTGQLTEEILKRNPEAVYGIEIDKTAYPLIEERFSCYENFHLIKDDFFNVNLYTIADKIKLVGNLPYNVSSLILINSVFYIDIIERCVYMVQKEVAQKLIAKPKTKDYTFLTVFLQTFFDIDYVMSVPARFFKPPPKVTSAVVKLTPKEKIPVHKEEIKDYKNFVSGLFSNKRKMLRSKIDKSILEKAGIKETARVEELSVSDFLKLYQIYGNFEK